MADFAKVAKEVFEVLQTFNYSVLMFDANGARVEEPEDARRFYSKDKNLMVSIKDDDDNSRISLQYGPSIHANDILGLDQTLKSIATQNALMFRANGFNKDIEPKDFVTMASINERKQDKKMTISSLTEGMYGTSRSSYLRLENARMIVRHSRRIDDSVIGARGRCVESIFIENAAGERLLFPSTQIAPARAMTQHVNQGGTFADEVGSHIMRMTTDFQNLAQASNYVNNNSMSLEEGAMVVREACRSEMRKMRKVFERLSRKSSYLAECKDMMEKAKLLKEAGKNIDETRLSEIRQLLNDADLPKEVYECACRAMDKMKEEPIVEADEDDYVPPPQSTADVFGHRVDKETWEQFAGLGKLDLKMHPKLKGEPHFSSRYAELCYKLGGLIPAVKDDSMARLLHAIVDDLTEFGENRHIPHSFQKKEKKWEEWKRAMIKIGVRALKAAHIPFETDLAQQNPAIREHLEWLDRFIPERVLENVGLDPYSMANGRDLGDFYDSALDTAVTDFDPEEFVDSPEMQDIISGREAGDPEENHLTHDEVMQGLRSYLDRKVQSQLGDYEGEMSSQVDKIAEEVYDRAVEALQEEGFIVQDDHNEEAGEQGDLLEDNELTMDDILINKPDMGDSLAHEVTKAMVQDPDTHKLKRPDASYISRLHTVGNTTTGTDGQAY